MKSGRPSQPVIQLRSLPSPNRGWSWALRPVSSLEVLIPLLAGSWFSFPQTSGWIIHPCSHSFDQFQLFGHTAAHNPFAATIPPSSSTWPNSHFSLVIIFILLPIPNWIWTLQPEKSRSSWSLQASLPNVADQICVLPTQRRTMGILPSSPTAPPCLEECELESPTSSRLRLLPVSDCR